MLCSLGMSYRQGGEFGVCGVSCTIYLHGYSCLGIESLGNDHEEKRGGNAFWRLWYAVILCGQCLLGQYEGKLLLFYSGWDIIICCWQMIQADTFSPLMQRAYWIVGHTFRLHRPVGLKRGPWTSGIVPILSPNVVILVIHQVLATSNSWVMMGTQYVDPLGQNRGWCCIHMKSFIKSFALILSVSLWSLVVDPTWILGQSIYMWGRAQGLPVTAEALPDGLDFW